MDNTLDNDAPTATKTVGSEQVLSQKPTNQSQLEVITETVDDGWKQKNEQPINAERLDNQDEDIVPGLAQRVPPLEKTSSFCYPSSQELLWHEFQRNTVSPDSPLWSLLGQGGHLHLLERLLATNYPGLDDKVLLTILVAAAKANPHRNHALIHYIYCSPLWLTPPVEILEQLVMSCSFPLESMRMYNCYRLYQLTNMESDRRQLIWGCYDLVNPEYPSLDSPIPDDLIAHIHPESSLEFLRLLVGLCHPSNIARILVRINEQVDRVIPLLQWCLGEQMLTRTIISNYLRHSYPDRKVLELLAETELVDLDQLRHLTRRYRD